MNIDDDTATPQPVRSRINPYPKGTPEYEEEKRVRARARERAYYAANKEKKLAAAKARRERSAAAQAEIVPGQAPPMPVKKMPVVWSVPDDLRGVLGSEIQLTTEWTGWPLFHVRRQENLGKLSMQQYKSYYLRLPKGSVWDQVRFILQQTPSAQNMFSKAGLSYICQSLYNSIYVLKSRVAGQSDYKERLLTMMVYSAMNKMTKQYSYAQHISQEASDERIEATVPWEQWKDLGRRYILALLKRPEIDAKMKKDMLIIWVYSQLPPVRLNWNDVKVVRTIGVKGTVAAANAHKTGNTLYISPSTAIMCWSEFKNAASFNDLPIQHRFTASEVKMLQRILPAGNSEPLKLPNFSTYLTRLAQEITGKKFSNRMMRSSYIRWWHENHDTTNVTAVKAMMRTIHQSNLEVHLGYIKHATTNGELSD